MRILVFTLFLLAARCLTSPVLDRRDLDGIFQTLETLRTTPAEHKTEQATSLGTAHASATQTATTAHVTSGDLGLLGHLASGSVQSSTAKETSGHVSGAAKALATTTTGTYSIIGTIPPLPSYPPWTMSTQTPTATRTTATSSPSSAPSTPKQSTASREWKIIGVAVIAFSTVVAILLLTVFFDSWTRFMKDMILKRKRNEGSEELVPDWEKASWDVRLGSDRHRYPSFASLPSETLMHGLGFTSPTGMNDSGNLNSHSYPKGPLERSASLRAAAGYPRDKESEPPAIHPINPQPYRPPAMDAFADQYVSPQIPTATRSNAPTRSRSQRSRRQQAENPFDDPPRSPGMTSIYGGIAS